MTTNFSTKILVTGASGNLGQTLIEHLSESGYTNLTATYLNHPENLPVFSGVDWKKLDILDTTALEDLMTDHEIVIHLAGIVSYQPKDKLKILKTNIEGTANVVNVAGKLSVRKLIHISSTAALGIPAEARIQDESYIPDPTQFLSDYALSKWYGELEVWRAISEGLNAIILSPSVILNPDNRNSNTRIYLNKLKEGLSYFPSGSNGFVNAKDVAKVIDLLIAHEIPEEKLVLNSANLSWLQFFTTINTNIGLTTNLKPPSSIYYKLLYIKNKIKSLMGKPLSVPTAMAKQMNYCLEYNGERITQILPFTYIPIGETISSYCIKD